MFTIPFALNSENRLVAPEDAAKGTAYFCPECHNPLTFRKCTKRRSHFAHRAKSKCSRESVIHVIGKLLVQRAFDDWWGGIAPQPMIQHKCKQCQSDRTSEFARGVNKHAYEYTFQSGYRADVALLLDDEPRFAVEVWYKSRVKDKKALDYGIEFAEVRPDDLMECNFLWKPINQAWQDRICDTCLEKNRVAEEQQKVRHEYERREKEHAEIHYRDIKARVRAGKFRTNSHGKPEIVIGDESTGRTYEVDDFWEDKLIDEYKDEARDIATRMGISLPTEFFRYKIDQCWHCEQTILLFKWPGKTKWGDRFRQTGYKSARIPSSKYSASGQGRCIGLTHALHVARSKEKSSTGFRCPIVWRTRIGDFGPIFSASPSITSELPDEGATTRNVRRNIQRAGLRPAPTTDTARGARSSTRRVPT